MHAINIICIPDSLLIDKTWSRPFGLKGCGRTPLAGRAEAPCGFGSRAGELGDQADGAGDCPTGPAKHGLKGDAWDTELRLGNAECFCFVFPPERQGTVSIWERKFKDFTKGSISWKNRWAATFQETSHTRFKNSRNLIVAWSHWWPKSWLSVKETRKILSDKVNEVKISLLVLQRLWSISETTVIINASKNNSHHSSALGSQGPKVTFNKPAPARQTSGRVLEKPCWISLSD